MEKTRQSAYEPEASFSRRFREVADAAYLGDGRNRILIRAFAQGLRSDELARKLAEEGNPTMLEEAFTTLACYSARKDACALHEEPMEVAPRVLPKPCGKGTKVAGVIAGRPVVDLQVGGLSIAALVDTGASCTLLRLDIFHWRLVLIAAVCWRTPQPCVSSPAHLWTSEGRPKLKCKE